MARLSGFWNSIRSTNPVLLLLCLFASAFGLLMVHSATLYKLTEDSPLSRDSMIMLLATALGFVCCIIISYIDYEMILKLWPLIAFVGLGLMGSLFIFGHADSEARDDAITWLHIGGENGISVQPSELLKIAFAITFSLHISAVGKKLSQLRHLLLLGVHGMIPTTLVILTGDLGSALVFIFMFAGLLFVAGLKLRYFAAAFALLGAAAPVLWIKFFNEYQKDRFLAVYYPNGMSEADYTRIIYQQQQGINAIGSGQLFGQGLFKGAYTQSHSVPVTESDMIFSVIGEELGFLGCLASILLLTGIIVCLVLAARKSRDQIGNLLCYGIALMIGSQAIINIGVCLKLLPCIGITLPFFSAGGSSNLCVYFGIGLVLSVFRFNRERESVDFRLTKIRAKIA